MSNLHLILQGKGGVGKSFIATILAQFLNDSNRNLLAVDADPANRTLAGFSTLNVHQVHLMGKHNDIDSSMFDKLIEMIIEHEGDALIDSGASSFISFSAYLLNNKILEWIQEHEKHIVIHIPITGGMALHDTLSGLDSLATHYPESCHFILWLNEFQGLVEYNGKSFSEMKAYLNHQDKISGMVRIPEQEELFDQAVREMMLERMTFDDVQQCMDSVLFGLIKKRRLVMFKQTIWEQLDTLRQEGVL